MFRVGDEVIINMTEVPKSSHKLYLSYFKRDTPYKVLRVYDKSSFVAISSEKGDATVTLKYLNIYNPSFAYTIKRKILSGGIENV